MSEEPLSDAERTYLVAALLALREGAEPDDIVARTHIREILRKIGGVDTVVVARRA